MIVAFTGHRSQKIGGYIIPNPTYDYIKEELIKILQELQPEKAFTGMALGFDQLAAETCLELNIPFVATVPFINQGKLWTQESKELYYHLVSKTYEVVIVSEGSYSSYKMQIRNEWMINNCDKVIAVWNNDIFGGTYNCIEYAKQIGKEIIIIDPRKINNLIPF